MELDIKNKGFSYSTDKYSSETKFFKIILEKVIFRKNTENEIKNKKEKKKHWESVIKALNRLIKEKNPHINLKHLNERQMNSIYKQLAENKIWKKLPVRVDVSDISALSIAQFFLYYWLAYNKLLNNKETLKTYLKVSGMVSNSISE